MVRRRDHDQRERHHEPEHDRGNENRRIGVIPAGDNTRCGIRSNSE